MSKMCRMILMIGCLTISGTQSQAAEQIAARTNICGTSIVWCVWVHYGRYPYTIGVANGIYGRSHPGWYKLAGVYANDRQAWRIACRYHKMNAYNSPDIQQGRIRC